MAKDRDQEWDKDPFSQYYHSAFVLEALARIIRQEKKKLKASKLERNRQNDFCL